MPKKCKTCEGAGVVALSPDDFDTNEEYLTAQADCDAETCPDCKGTGHQ
jgi:DnaJ-class molecular chaperone